MIRAVRTVFRKEIVENLRDHRVILSALFFGVLLAPAIFALATTIVSKRAIDTQDNPLQLPVAGGEHAPNLMRFLLENGVEVLGVELSAEAAQRAVRNGEHDLVLIVDEQYAQELRRGASAPVHLVMDSANSQATPGAERARRMLDAYGGQLAALRLLARGVSPETISPLDVRMVDVATPAGRALLLLGIMTYFCFTSMLAGGFYLAIDTTAGERERGSLEPLLSLPVSRASLITGKMLATAAFMSMSLLLTLAAFGVVLMIIPLEALGMSANFGPRVILGMFAVMATFIPLGAGLMTVVASFTRSNREAQSWLSMVMFLPIAPIMFAVVSGTKPSTALMAVPSLSQHLLATGLMRGDEIPALHVAVSAGATLMLGALLVWLAIRLYRREAILG